MVLSTHRWRELDSNHRSRRERDGRRQRPAALAGHLIKDLSPDRTVLSLSHGRLVIGANCNYALPRQLLLFLTSKFGFCRLRLTESATRDWRVRPIYSSGSRYVKLEPTRSSHRIGLQPASAGWVCCRAVLYPELRASRKTSARPMVAEGSKLRPLPMNHRVADRASGEERLSRE